MANGIVTARAVRRVTVNGGNLFELALSELGDALQWRRIAQVNGLLDPFLPSTVLTLIIPPANKNASTSGIIGG